MGAPPNAVTAMPMKFDPQANGHFTRANRTFN